MNVLSQALPKPSPIPGIDHVTLAGEEHGLRQLSVWRQSLAAGVATPPHRHDCDEVVLCQSGEGEVLSQGRVQRFASGSTLILPGGHLHQIVNTGPGALELLGIFPQTPVQAWWPDGTAMDLPWRS